VQRVWSKEKRMMSKGTSKLSAPILIEWFLILAILLTYGWATYHRNFIWKDEITLWLDVVKKSPEKSRPYNNVGLAYFEKRLIDEAMPYFIKSLSLDPDSPSTHNNLGLCFSAKGWVDQAIEEFRQAVKLNPSNGMFHVDLGIAYWQKGLTNLAREEIQLGKNLKKTETRKPFFH